MAIPWIIGGAVAAVAAYALSGDDDSSRSSSSSNSSSSNKADKEKEAKQQELTGYAEKQITALAKRYEVEDADILNRLIFTPKPDFDEATYLSNIGSSMICSGGFFSTWTRHINSALPSQEHFDDVVEKCWQISKKAKMLTAQVNIHEERLCELTQTKSILECLLDE